MEYSGGKEFVSFDLHTVPFDFQFVSHFTSEKSDVGFKGFHFSKIADTNSNKYRQISK